MKLIVFVGLFALAASQRPSYAGSSAKGIPGLANRFKDPNATDTPLDNRLGNTENTSKIPVDARGDHDLVNRISQWPRENQPFWYLNAEAIEAHRNSSPQEQLATQQRVNVGASQRSSFASSQRFTP